MKKLINNKPYGYIYRNTNMVNDKTYIGMHRKSELDESYFGSGIKIVEAVNKYGKDNFKLEVLQFCYSEDELCKQERYWIAKEREKGKAEYNIANGGKGWNTSHYGENNPFYGKHHSQETRKRLSELGKKRVGPLNGFYGHKMTPEHLAKTRRTGSTQSLEIRKKISNSLSKESKCKVCGKVFKSVALRDKHYKENHAQDSIIEAKENLIKRNKEPIKCKYCGKIIHSKGNMTQHIRAKHNK